MDGLVANLQLGFATALSWQNPGLAIIGCLVGTLVGVLPGVGPIATITMLLPIHFEGADVHVHLRLARRRGARQPGQHRGEPAGSHRAVRRRRHRRAGAARSHARRPDLPFAENHVVLNGERNGLRGSFTSSEWAGAPFEPKKGERLFADIQSPGITFAITGPWKTGAV
jgi:hypothetical protein